MLTDIKKFVIGPIENNTYLLVGENNRCLVIDPAIGTKALTQHIEEAGLQVEAVLLTHGHCDHLLGLDDLQEAFPDTPVYIHPDDKPYLQNVELNGSMMVIGKPYRYDGAVLSLTEGPMQVGSFEFEVIHLPGHTPGGVALLFENICLTGDSLFAGSVGRTDFPGSNAAHLIQSLKGKLLKLPEETLVLAGHGPETTIGREAKSNPFLN